jgi:hypothetical protein
MRYGQIAGNKKICASIYQCFEFIRVEDERKFIRKFRQQPHDQSQILHSFRELILGAFLASNGLDVKHDHKIDGQTPDWSIFDKDLCLKGIVELVNFHPNKATEDSIKRDTRDGNVWCDWVQPNNSRLYQCIQEKAERYERITQENHVPYFVAVFCVFTAAVEPEEIHEVLFKDYDGGLFKQCSAIGGVLYFEERAGQYIFKYIRNPRSIISFDLPTGVFL